ncbi:hypothetical protein Cfor_03721 [Coptotermes formosanus]|uniref:Reverse transcriptase domain-containing protein n=1 Tax=Coptotermes formosanus TaxID=36987 RepID=A0A6L2PZY7_COPFO|nr:hypothetical protein Cfor_03721 [Coptotermes formosanus]
MFRANEAKNLCGYDEIPTKILKLSVPFIISPLTYICNKRLSQGVFPGRLKFSVVKPILKNGDKLITSSYRPMSLLVYFSKVFEKLIYSRLYEHISISNILDTEKYGFRTNTSTENASYKLTHEILSAVNGKCVVGGVFCYLGKAFDCVNHNILLEKLQFYGIVGKFQALIKSYLSERYQKVFIDNINFSNNAASNWEEVKHGVPQDSILGPLFFLVYVNDLPKITATDAKISLYANDTSIIVTKPNLEDFKITVNEIFLDINKWLKTNPLSLNLKKKLTMYNLELKIVMTVI